MNFLNETFNNYGFKFSKTMANFLEQKLEPILPVEPTVSAGLLEMLANPQINSISIF